MANSKANTEEVRLPFMGHLRELRARIIRSLVFLVFWFVVAFIFREEVYDWFMLPYRAGMEGAFGEGARVQMDFRGPVEPFLVYLKSSLLASLIVSAPMIVHQIWRFVMPGLLEKTRKITLPFIVATYLFFLGGVLFCHYVVMVPAMQVLLSFASPDQANPSIMMQEYFSFTRTMLLLFGAVFELPVAIVFLAVMDLITSKTLMKYWRHIIVLSFVVGAMLTPPDPLTQVALALPLVVLYFMATGIVVIIERVRGKHREDQIEEDVEPEGLDTVE